MFSSHIFRISFVFVLFCFCFCFLTIFSASLQISAIKSVTWDSPYFNKNMQILTKICKFYQKYANFTKNMQLLPKICNFLRNICKFYQKYANFIKNMQLLQKKNFFLIFTNGKSPGRDHQAVYSWLQINYISPKILHSIIS